MCRAGGQTSREGDVREGGREEGGDKAWRTELWAFLSERPWSRLGRYLSFKYQETWRLGEIRRWTVGTAMVVRVDR